MKLALSCLAVEDDHPGARASSTVLAQKTSETLQVAVTELSQWPSRLRSIPGVAECTIDYMPQVGE